VIGFPQKALTRAPYKFTVSTDDNNDIGMESNPTIALNAASIAVLAALPVNEENSSEIFGTLLNTPKPVVTKNTKNTASMQVLRCAINACFAYALISCLGLIIINSLLSCLLLPGQYIKDHGGCQ